MKSFITSGPGVLELGIGGFFSFTEGYSHHFVSPFIAGLCYTIAVLFYVFIAVDNSFGALHL